MSTTEQTIETWMRQTLNDGGVERFDDLHIDQIDDRWTSNDQWVSGGVECFRIAARLRDTHALKVNVAVAFSLRATPSDQRVDFDGPDHLSMQLDWSSPSLYLFYEGKEPWRLQRSANDQEFPTDFCLHRLDATKTFGGDFRLFGCYLIEFRNSESDEYSRTVLLTT